MHHLAIDAPAASSTRSWTAFVKEIARPGVRRALAERVRTRLWSDGSAIGFRRDLGVAFAPPEAKIALTIRRLTAAEAPAILDGADRELDCEERWERAARLRLWLRGLGRCFAAIAPDGRPCYVQWLFGPADNAGLKAYFGEAFPELAPGEALLEGAFTPGAFRGRGIMPAAMARIALEAAALDAHRVHTFVGIDNLPSLKGCVRAGFAPHQWRDQSWRLGHRRTVFGPLPADFASRFAPLLS